MQQSMTLKELIHLAAVDSDLYCRTFFPKAFRCRSAPFHRESWDLLEDNVNRFVALEVFRGGAKTTTLRAYTSKRIAYGISRTILFVSASQEHSKKSLAWLRGAVDRNSEWAQVYNIQRGSKWTDEISEFYHGVLGVPITVIALGITGQIRGINVDDYRPDLIVVDDACDEENTATEEQRQKVEARFFGALAKSLASRTDSPDAKMVFLQTSLNANDLINKCHSDPQWASRKFPCFDENGESTWPDMYSTDDLKKDKEAHVARQQLPLWLREMECKIIAPETASFKLDWLKYYAVPPMGCLRYLGLDPVPPPSERELEVGLVGKHDEALAVVGFLEGNVFLLDYSVNRGHTPEWTIAEFFRLCDKWRVMKARVESVAYQRTLKWLLEQEMKKRLRWIQIDDASDRRKKMHRILQAFSGLASQGRLYVRKEHEKFITQFGEYPNGKDDLLDAVAMAIDAGSGLAVVMDGVDGSYTYEGEPLDDWRSAPWPGVYS